MKKILLITLIGICCGINAQEKIQTEVGLKNDFIYKNGDIGIGTINPLGKFHIKNLNSSPVLNITGKAPNTGNDELISEIRLSNLYDNLSGHRASIKAISDKSGSHGNVAFQFNTSTWNGQHTEIQAMRISSNGNVGIGTKSPDMKLTVKGNIHAEEVKIDLNVPAPDYVFKENYNLKSIEEVENFIKENGHLPEIQSAREFEQNGIMQAEMDMNLLKKIEELTLYTIQQQKEIKELKTLNIKLLALQSRLEKLEAKK
nr:tail fiber protein [uncultured Allomuricauda sp.]